MFERAVQNLKKNKRTSIYSESYEVGQLSELAVGIFTGMKSLINLLKSSTAFMANQQYNI
jgi:hypothetical protein